MNMLECMNTTIEYIEEHLLEELHMPTIAMVAGTSESDIQKTFYALTGISIVEYVRRRRLSLAGFELQKGEKSVLEIALEYGYTSPDSFTRAFRQMHGITPSAVKKEMQKKITALSNNDGVVGLCADMYDGGFDYWIGCMSDNECPEDLEEMTIPASSWRCLKL